MSPPYPPFSDNLLEEGLHCSRAAISVLLIRSLPVCHIFWSEIRAIFLESPSEVEWKDPLTKASGTSSNTVMVIFGKNFTMCTLSIPFLSPFCICSLLQYSDYPGPIAYLLLENVLALGSYQMMISKRPTELSSRESTLPSCTIPISCLPHIHQLHPPRESADLPTLNPYSLQGRCIYSYPLWHLALWQISNRLLNQYELYILTIAHNLLNE